MDVRILGPFEVRAGGRVLDLGGRRPRTLLAVLAVHAGEVVSADRLIEHLWGDDPPRSAHHLVHVYVSNLRKAVGSSLVTRSPGYVLKVGEDDVDARRFERALDDGRRLLALGDVEGASTTLRDALSLWRGPALVDFIYDPFAQIEIARLEELRLVAREERVEAELALGRHLEMIAELDPLVAANPLRERPRGQLMVALYRAGRQADALAAYRDARRVLVEEIGIEPGPALKQLEQAILRQDAALDVPATASPLRVRRLAARKLVTVVVAGLADPGEVDGLDPETRRRFVARFEDAVGAVLARHGGAVERFPDERVMGVLGVPEAHDDDALRAVKAAAEIRESLRVAVGVETGEVVADGKTVSGDVVTRAFSLAHAAAGGAVLLGPTTYRLVRHAVLAEGGSGPERARLVAVLPDATPFPRRLDSPFVGRAGELEHLAAVFADAVRDRRIGVVTLVGDPGVGKSRLAQELASRLAEQATPLVGRCVPYGEGATYRPLREIVRRAVGAETRDALQDALRGETERDTIVAGVLAAIGTDEPARGREESFWAIGKLFDALARERPLLVVVEDLHCAEPVLLALVEYLAERGRGGPALVLGLARPELLQSRPDWPARALPPVSRAHSEALLRGLVGDAALPGDVQARVVDAAGGNPLFLEQLLAALAEEGGSADEIVLPTSIRAVLAARLDRLGPAERAVLERAAVAGREVALDAVAALLPEDALPGLDRHALALARKDLVAVESGTVRFRHALIQEAAYRAVPKAVRAELHERLGEWLDDRRESDELVGYHLEQAFRLHEQLQAVDWHARRLAARAADRLGAAGRRAIVRDDPPSAASLLERAVSLFPDAEPRRLAFLPDLVEALREVADLDRATAVASEAVDLAAAARDRRLEALARIEYAYVCLMTSRGGAVEDALATGKHALAVFDELGDDAGIAKAWRLMSVAYRFRGRQSARREALERALAHVQRTGDRRTASWIYDGLGGVHNYGPGSVDELLRFARESIEWARANGARSNEAHGLAQGLGRSYAMLGDFEAARRAIAEARAIVDDLGFVWHRAGIASAAGFVEALAGDLDAAERELRAGCELVERARMTGSYFGMALRDELAEVLCAQGRYEEAKALSEASEREAAEDDVQAQVLWRAVRAKALAREGALDDAETLAAAAVAIAEETEFVIVHANSLLALADVLRLARRREAAPVVRRALALYEQKGDRVSAQRARDMLAELGTTIDSPVNIRR